MVLHAFGLVCSHIAGLITVALVEKMLQTSLYVMSACMCTRCLSVHVDQQLHCSRAVLDDGSSLLLSCAEVAAPQCSAHHSGCSSTTLHTQVFRGATLENSPQGTGELGLFPPTDQETHSFLCVPQQFTLI